jgi:hypothetical protein
MFLFSPCYTLNSERHEAKIKSANGDRLAAWLNLIATGSTGL